MSENLYGHLYLQLLSKLSRRTPLEVIWWALSKNEPPAPNVDIGSPLERLIVPLIRWTLWSLQPAETSGGVTLRLPVSTVTVEQEAAATEADVGISKLIGDRDTQYVYPLLDWWWPDPPEGYIDPNAYFFLSRMPKTGPRRELTTYEPSIKDLYSIYRNVLLRTPNIVGANAAQPTEDWVAEHTKALADCEKPSNPSEEKPGFVKMTTNAGSIPIANFVVANGKDWISELKKKAKEKGDQETFSPGGDTGLIGVHRNLSLNFTNRAFPAISLPFNIPTHSGPFFAVFTSSKEWEKFEIAQDDEKVSVLVKVGAVARVPVQPDPHWYDSDYLQKLAKRDSWNPPFTKADIFGEKGLLSQRINGLIAAYHISFEITVSPETYQKYRQIFGDALGFRIGPFLFGISIPILIAGIDATQKFPMSAGWKHKANPETSTFEGESTADYPTIVGVTVESILHD